MVSSGGSYGLLDLSRRRSALNIVAMATIVALFGCDRTPPASPASPSASAPVPPDTVADSPWEKAQLAGVEFRAIGQEPGWLVELDQGREVRYTGDYGETRFVAPAPEPGRDAASGTTTYTARADSHEFVLHIRETPCQDAMSGESFRYDVTVRFDGKELNGCGRTLATADYFGIYWKLTELNGAASVTGAREAYLRFASNARLTGSTGCNSLSGSYFYKLGLLRVHQAVTTRIACLDQTLAHQEREFLRVLETPANLTMIVSDGRMTLSKEKEVVAGFDAVYLR
jgi:heat shock protein HslJ/uncharacterized membrane protein